MLVCHLSRHKAPTGGLLLIDTHLLGRSKPSVSPCRRSACATRPRLLTTHTSGGAGATPLYGRPAQWEHLVNGWLDANHIL